MGPDAVLRPQKGCPREGQSLAPKQHMLTSSRDSRKASSLCTLSCMALSLSSRCRVMCSTCPGEGQEQGWKTSSPAYIPPWNPRPVVANPGDTSFPEGAAPHGFAGSKASQCHTQVAACARVLSRGWSGVSGSGICRGWQRTPTQHPKVVRGSTARGVRWGQPATPGGR